MRSPTRRCFAAAAALLAAEGAAHAQTPSTGQPEEGPVIVGRRREDWEYFKVDHFETAAEFYARGSRDTITQTGQPKAVDKESLYRETLNLSGRAFIGHQNFIDILGSAKLGLEDQYLNSQTLQVDTHEQNFANNYDMQALILGNGPVPVTVYTRRDEQVLDRDFAPSINSTTSETGISADIRSEVAPTTLRVFHLETSQNDPTGLSNYNLEQDSFAGRSRLRLGDAHYLEVRDEYDHIKEQLSQGGTTNYDRNELTLEDLISFGEDNKHELRSFFRYYVQTDQPELQIIRLDEHLLFRHSDRFETRYNFTANEQQQAGVDQRLFAGNASFRHQLFDSLVTTGSVGGDVLEIPGDFQSEGGFINGGLQYTKKVPLGTLNANANLGYNLQHNGERGSDIGVVDQPYTFVDPLPIVIPRRNVVSGSVVVTGPGGIPTYQEGLDYTATYYPDRVEINRIIGGAIPNDQTVLVDYTLGPEPASEIDTSVGALGVRYTFTDGMLEGLSAYSTYRFINNNVSGASADQIPLEDVRDLIFGLEYRIGGLSLKAEREHRDSTFNPYDSTLLQALYFYRLGPESSLSADATYQATDSPDPNFQLTYLFLSGRWNQRIATGLTFRIELQYIENHNEQSGDTTGFEQIFGLNWRKGRTSIYATIRNSTLDGQSGGSTGLGPTFQNTESQRFEFGLTRTF